MHRRPRLVVNQRFLQLQCARPCNRIWVGSLRPDTHAHCLHLPLVPINETLHQHRTLKERSHRLQLPAVARNTSDAQAHLVDKVHIDSRDAPRPRDERERVTSKDEWRRQSTSPVAPVPVPELHQETSSGRTTTLMARRSGPASWPPPLPTWHTPPRLAHARMWQPRPALKGRDRRSSYRVCEVRTLRHHQGEAHRVGDQESPFECRNG